MWKDIGKAGGWKHPRAPSARLLWKEKATEAVLDFLRDTRVGCMVTLRPAEEEDGEGSEGEAGGLGPPRPYFPSSFTVSIPFAYSSSRVIRDNWTEEPY